MSNHTTPGGPFNPDQTQPGLTPNETVLDRVAEQLSNLRHITQIIKIIRNRANFAHLAFRTPTHVRCLQDQDLNEAVRSIRSMFEYLRAMPIVGQRRVEFLESMTDIWPRLHLIIRDLEYMLLHPASSHHDLSKHYQSILRILRIGSVVLW
ncbi:hypothetical protein P167DRAFT_548609 [Morchella conica CCBAS932]|uniref:Uncharacterized protein n=1 Tax=Morchella conica CCBAS932 TaxID=1392247 RepID=A0A3N4KHP4_9PEZI|nr:hypothetical protein P167DRAFT_548609 [Morchella conica CCBAS932]